MAPFKLYYSDQHLQPMDFHYDSPDFRPESPPLQPVKVHFPSSRSPSPTSFAEDALDRVFDDSCEGLMSDLYPQLPKSIPDYLPPAHSNQYRWGTQMDLPLTVRGTVIHTRPDSGCEENIMSAKMAEDFGLPVNRREEDRKSFRIASGRIVEAVGRVSIWSCFPEEPWKEMRLEFYLFRQTATPIIMGMTFLTETRVFNENRHRLHPRKVKRCGPYQVSLLNAPMKTLHCLVNSEPARGYPDTGSEVDLMSARFVKKREFKLEALEDEENEVLFADGSSAKLVGKVTISLIVCSDSPLETDLVFYVLPDLTCDMLFGEEFLYRNDIFHKHHTALATGKATAFSDVNGIFWKTKTETFFSKLFSGRSARAPSSGESDENGNYAMKQQHNDSWELHRRELALEHINGLVGAQKDSAIREENIRIAQYESNRPAHTFHPVRIGNLGPSNMEYSGVGASEWTSISSNQFSIGNSQSYSRRSITDQNIRHEALLLRLPPMADLSPNLDIFSTTEALQATISSSTHLNSAADAIQPRASSARTNTHSYDWPSDHESDTESDTEDESNMLSAIMHSGRRNGTVTSEFRCSMPDCTSRFTTKALLNRHVKYIHGSDGLN